MCLQVQKLLGKGSYGIVYRVKRKSDGVVYALKEADVRKMSPVERMDAVNEIRLLASVKHQNVVRYHEAFLDGEGGCPACRQCCRAGLLDFPAGVHAWQCLSTLDKLPLLVLWCTHDTHSLSPLQATSCALSWSMRPTGTCRAS